MNGSTESEKSTAVECNEYIVTRAEICTLRSAVVGERFVVWTDGMDEGVSLSRQSATVLAVSLWAKHDVRMNRNASGTRISVEWNDSPSPTVTLKRGYRSVSLVVDRYERARLVSDIEEFTGQCTVEAGDLVEVCDVPEVE